MTISCSEATKYDVNPMESSLLSVTFERPTNRLITLFHCSQAKQHEKTVFLIISICWSLEVKRVEISVEKQ
jgi:hypothetical protein